MIKNLFYLTLFALLSNTYASGTMSEDEVKNVNRVNASSQKEQQQLSIAAGLLADYEILAKKLVASIGNKTVGANEINKQASELLLLSEIVIKSAQFRLPQCDEYLASTIAIRDNLLNMPHATLEKDYHHDGALPKAPAECYHTKDLFVHPATVIILTRDDPSLNEETKTSINAEISEVLAHTEVVRQLVIY